MLKIIAFQRRFVNRLLIREQTMLVSRHNHEGDSMKKLFIFIIALIFALASCAPVSGGEDDGASKVNSDGTFKLSIYTDKKEYKAGEMITCYAIVEYTGDGDGVVIYSANPLMGFALKDDKYFDGTYAVADVLISTEFEKGVPVTFEFSKSGGWSGEDENAAFYEQFYSEKELKLPAGEYEISAAIDGFFDKDDYQGSEYVLKASVNLRVK